MQIVVGNDENQVLETLSIGDVLLILVALFWFKSLQLLVSDCRMNGESQPHSMLITHHQNTGIKNLAFYRAIKWALLMIKFFVEIFFHLWNLWKSAKFSSKTTSMPFSSVPAGSPVGFCVISATRVARFAKSRDCYLCELDFVADFAGRERISSRFASFFAFSLVRCKVMHM